MKKVITLLFLLSYGIVVYGFVLMKFWAWFIHPLGVIWLGYSQCVGLGVFLALIKSGTSKSSEIDEEYVIKQIITPWIYLLMGYITYLFIS